MNRLYSSLLAATALTFSAAAQQLPNAGFEDGWKDCIPWTSNGNTKTKGTTPGDWTISQVIGMAGTGATGVGEKVEGYESESAVKVYNSPNSVAKNQTVPGYVTLGTTWSTAQGFNASNKDGGTFGGIQFTGRPEKITFMYKFERSGDNTQPANAIVYLWKGTFIQKDVPGNISLGSPTKKDMNNRDRVVLGIDMSNSQGGAVTQKGELIAEGKLVITEVTSEWKKGEVVLDYKSDATPEMINVIFAANDYFNSESIVQGNELTIDNVECVYSKDPNLKEYSGTLTVVCDMLGGDLTDGGQSTNIEITPNADKTACTFRLPDLSLGSMGSIGEIKVDNVKMTHDNGITSFAGEVKNMMLLDGNIDADVNVTGTCDAQGNLVMKIDVIWHSGSEEEGGLGEVPIYVAFNGKGDPIKTSAIGGIESDVIDENAPVEYYNIQGVKVNGDNLAPGFYIVRQGKKVSKIFVK